MKKLFLSLLMFCSLHPASGLAATTNIAAASDLKFALEELSQAYERDTGEKLALSFGSSGVFATQIRNGAPFQLYLSADEDYALKLHADGYTLGKGALYAIGRLVILVPKISAMAVDAQLQGLARYIEAGRLQRFAIANPEHAPYGRRAVEALQHADLWQAVQPRLVLGENVSQAAQFAVSGSADGGMVALSLVKAPQLAASVNYAVIPADWHSPLRQRMVLLKGAGKTAQAFYAYLQTPAARAVFRRYGFSLPQEKD